jgi:hypothetical protein
MAAKSIKTVTPSTAVALPVAEPVTAVMVAHTAQSVLTLAESNIALVYDNLFNPNNGILKLQALMTEKAMNTASLIFSIGKECVLAVNASPESATLNSDAKIAKAIKIFDAAITSAMNTQFSQHTDMLESDKDTFKGTVAQYQRNIRKGMKVVDITSIATESALRAAVKAASAGNTGHSAPTPEQTAQKEKEKEIIQGLTKDDKARLEAFRSDAVQVAGTSSKVSAAVAELLASVKLVDLSDVHNEDKLIAILSEAITAIKQETSKARKTA